MRVTIIGSRGLCDDISKYIPEGTTEIISGGALRIDSLVEKWADENNIPKLVIRPDYMRYGKAAPFIRNRLMIEVAERIVAVWDGRSQGTRFSIDYARKIGKPVEVYLVEK